MKFILMGIGDWGLGPIPNPQSPIKLLYLKQKNQYLEQINNKNYFQKIIKK